MTIKSLGYEGDLTPKEAWDMLSRDAQAQLIDCRTQPEWDFVGVPDLRVLDKRAFFIPWQVYPHMQQNEHFAAELKNQGLLPENRLLFICRSGGRSRMAAIAMTSSDFPHCYNVVQGFEGDRNEQGHRSHQNGWKYHQLPWSQD